MNADSLHLTQRRKERKGVKEWVHCQLSVGRCRGALNYFRLLAVL